MHLILAIEPDRRQSSKIAAIAKHTLKVELLAAESTEKALALLKGRVPDLILTSLLLSPKDESALADWLREGAGAHVQTLMIPVLGSSQRRSSGGGGLLTRLTGRGSSDNGTDGCDPDVFATQIQEYLDGVAEERRTAAEDLEDAEALALDAAGTHDASGEAVEEEIALDEPWAPVAVEEEPESVELTAEAIDLDKFVAELNAAPPQPPPPARPASAAPSAVPDAVEEFAAALGAMTAAEGTKPRAQHTARAASPAPPSDGGRKKKKGPAPTIEDEWGFFDPERSGFPALLAKLEELADSNDQ